MKINPAYTQRLVSIVSSSNFFWGIVVLLVLQAAWIALTGRYPMAFDEEAHLGVIRLFADHLSPFWSAQPAGADAFGAVVRDPSYLFHYLLSFPYRLIELFTDNQPAQVLILRGINIAMFASALPLFRRLLLKTGTSPAIVHLCLLVFVLVPISPFLAAQINYDNLIMPLTALSLLMALKLNKSFTKRSLDAKTLLQLLIVCLLASLVKYAFLPVFAAIVVFLLVQVWRTYRSIPVFAKVFSQGWHKLSRVMAVGLTAGLILSAGMFAERYGYNLVRYHTPVADCAQVLNYDHCRHYGPWIRDYDLERNKSADAETSPLRFNEHWFHGMWFRSVFAVDGPTNGFQTRGPLLLPALSLIVLPILGGLALLVTARRLWNRYNKGVLALLGLASALHIAIVWLQQYQMFLQTGKAVAINGRYLLPVAPFLILITALAVNELLGPRRGLKLAVGSIVVTCFLLGGGALTYILRSDVEWYWPNSTVETANKAIQDTIGPITPGYSDSHLFVR